MRGWERPDFVYVIGDAYVDHPSFGHAIISRVLEAEGFKVGIISQPDWRSKDDFMCLGKPRLGFLVSSGNIDSMVNHYTAAKKRRSSDAYTPGGEGGKRPDRCVIVYCNRIREAYGDVPIIIGGVEASLRRFAHYDYWDDRVRRSVLIDSRADILTYGMGERQIPEIAHLLDSGVRVKDIKSVDGSVFCIHEDEIPEDAVILPSFEEVRDEKSKYADSVRIQYEQTDAVRGKPMVQKHQDRYILQTKPCMPLSTRELDRVYSLPYERTYHPSYKEGVPAIEEVKFSLASSRGCYGSCNFCALAFHQGRVVTSRSHASLLEEAKKFVHDPDFKGYIHDVGGPTANFRHPSCQKQLEHGVCQNRQCLFPKPCPNLTVDHSDYVSLLRKLRALPGVKKVFVRSGIRFDYLMADPDDTFIRELCQYHISGQLRVAPEHVADPVLCRMGKPENAVYEKFVRRYARVNGQVDKKQYLVPYLMSSHPGSGLAEAVTLAEYLRDLGYMPEQVQDFYPTPSTPSTCMYYTGVDPATMEPVYVPTNPHEKAMQRALMQYRNPHNYDLVKEALIKAGRTDLIGFDEKCLIRPRKEKWREQSWDEHQKKSRKDTGSRLGDTRRAKKPGAVRDGAHPEKAGKRAGGKNAKNLSTNGRAGAKNTKNAKNMNVSGRNGGTPGKNLSGRTGKQTGRSKSGRRH